MNSSRPVQELLTQQFYDWERRGRGWAVAPGPVELEPPFRPFHGHFLPRPEFEDDARVETTISRMAGALLGWNSRKQLPAPRSDVGPPEPDIVEERTDLLELQTLLPAKLDIPREPFQQFLTSLHFCRAPIAFEIVGTPESITAQFAVDRGDARVVRQQLQAYFPDAAFLPNEGSLERAFPGGECAVVEFGLDREFMLLLATQRLDPFVGITGALAELDADEFGLYQVVFQPVRKPWAASVLRAASGNEGGDFFLNAPELLREARRKVATQLYAAVVRIVTASPDFDRAWEIVRNLAGSLRVFADPGGNELIPLRNDEYPLDEHLNDALRRQCRRHGMILNSDELIGFVHLPGSVVRSPKLERQAVRTKAAPTFPTGAAVHLGANTHLGRQRDVFLPDDTRLRHVHVIGATGTGKSTLLLHLMRQDMERGHGLALLDPHGDLADQVMALVPAGRRKEVVVFDPTDADFPIGFNILAAHSELEKNLLASDLVSVFARLSTSWGDQMGSVLQNAILAFLESSRGGTLIELRRFLIESGFREQFLKTVGDPDVVYYWRKGFGLLTGNKSIGPVLTRLETFLARKTLRHMVAQRTNRLDFTEILNSRRIFLARLPQGQIGQENAFLLGSLLVTRFQQAAMARQAQSSRTRHPYWLYLDEFQHFITPSMAEILSGARKYGLGLILAHQELQHLARDREVASAVLNNAATRICFRVGDDDAKRLAEGFSAFEAGDIRNLGKGEAIVRIERSDADFNLNVPLTDQPGADEAAQIRQEIVAESRTRYGTPRAEVEPMLFQQLGLDEPEPEPPPSKPRSAARPSPAPAPPTPHPTTSPTSTPSAATPPPAPLPPKTVPIPASPEPTQEPQSEPTTPETERRHERIKAQITEQAESLDYTVTAEEKVPGTEGRADLVLRRGDQTIACEISVTTTADHEAANVRKCLQSNYTHIAVITTVRSKLARIQQLVTESVTAADAARVGYYRPEQFITHFYDRAAADPAGGTAEKGKPRKQRIALSSAPHSDEERRALEAEMLKRLAESMRTKNKTS